MVPSKYMPLDGANAVSQAMRQIDPDVVAAYPITPQTAVVQNFSEYVADGIVHTEFVPVESEHAAMSACVGASGWGARHDGHRANGLALMWEMLYIASGMRLPIVLTVVNRALSSPLNIHCDHSDSDGRHATLAGFSSMPRPARKPMTTPSRPSASRSTPICSRPVMSCQDGFITGHGVERVGLLPDDAVREFVGPTSPRAALLDTLTTRRPWAPGTLPTITLSTSASRVRRSMESPAHHRGGGRGICQALRASTADCRHVGDG
jgi:pyruvate ferredoxin oxidoreductase alpha subunit